MYTAPPGVSQCKLQWLQQKRPPPPSNTAPLRGDCLHPSATAVGVLFDIPVYHPCWTIPDFPAPTEEIVFQLCAVLTSSSLKLSISITQQQSHSCEDCFRNDREGWYDIH